MSLNEKLLKLRTALNLGHAQIAQRIGVNPSTYGDWEAGSTVPKLNQYLKLATGFGLPVTEFLPEDFLAAIVAELASKNGGHENGSSDVKHYEEIIASLKGSLSAKDELISHLKEHNQRQEAELKKYGGG